MMQRQEGGQDGLSDGAAETAVVFTVVDDARSGRLPVLYDVQQRIERRTQTISFSSRRYKGSEEPEVLMEEVIMARAIFSHELSDPDFQWLLSSYTESKHATTLIDAPCLPIVLLLLTPEEKAAVLTQPAVPVLPPNEHGHGESAEDPSTE